MDHANEQWPRKINRATFDKKTMNEMISLLNVNRQLHVAITIQAWQLVKMTLQLIMLHQHSCTFQLKSTLKK